MVTKVLLFPIRVYTEQNVILDLSYLEEQYGKYEKSSQKNY